MRQEEAKDKDFHDKRMNRKTSQNLRGLGKGSKEDQGLTKAAEMMTETVVQEMDKNFTNQTYVIKFHT